MGNALFTRAERRVEMRANPSATTRALAKGEDERSSATTLKILKRFKDSARNLFYIFLRHKDYIKANGTMRETIKKVLDEDLLPELSKIQTKTLIIWGDKDRMVPVKYAYIFKEKIENAKLEILPKIGHSPHLEAPENFSEIIINFLEKS